MKCDKRNFVRKTMSHPLKGLVENQHLPHVATQDMFNCNRQPMTNALEVHHHHIPRYARGFYFRTIERGHVLGRH